MLEFQNKNTRADFLSGIIKKETIELLSTLLEHTHHLSKKF